MYFGALHFEVIIIQIITKRICCARLLKGDVSFVSLDKRPKIRRASVVFPSLDPELFNDSKTQRGLHKNCTRRDCRGSESTDGRKRGHEEEKERKREELLKFTPGPQGMTPSSFLGGNAVFFFFFF